MNSAAWASFRSAAEIPDNEPPSEPYFILQWSPRMPHGTAGKFQRERFTDYAAAQEAMRRIAPGVWWAEIVDEYGNVLDAVGA